MTPDGERREGMGEVLDRLNKIEQRLARIEGGLVLAGFLAGIAAAFVSALHL